MILTAGSPDALSFTDGTSLPNAGATVSIDGQVIRELSLDWYYALLQRAPYQVSELKSTVIVDVFFTLPDFERRRVMSTLKTVRIYVTDPRPYTHQVDEFLTDIVPGGDIPGFIRRLNRSQQQVAENERRKLIARRMLRDAPPQQVKLRHIVLEYLAGLRIGIWPREPLVDEKLVPCFEQEPLKEVDLTPFERSRKSMVNILSPFLSKSGSVFCEVLDCMDEFIERGAQSAIPAAFTLWRILSGSHAFDEGDAKEVQWIDGERNDVLRRVDRYGMFPMQPAALPELDSRSSFFVQAADFAAGIAREIWSRNSLPHLVDKFDYVTYNGRRISESEAVTLAANLAKRGHLAV
jgi:hypothetical protein